MKCPDDIKLRPIVGGPQSPTSHLSHLIEIILKPLLKHVLCDLEDELTFLISYPRDIFEQNGIFITVDVCSMFTNIHAPLMLNAIEFWITSYPNSVNPKYTLSFIKDAIMFLMNNNYFYFNGKLYRQKKGGAMGSVCIPTLCRLSMGFLEETKLFPALRDTNPLLESHLRKYYKRYMDDGFFYI